MALSIAKQMELYYQQRQPSGGAYVADYWPNEQMYCVRKTSPAGCYFTVYYMDGVEESRMSATDQRSYDRGWQRLTLALACIFASSVATAGNPGTYPDQGAANVACHEWGAYWVEVVATDGNPTQIAVYTCVSEERDVYPDRVFFRLTGIPGGTLRTSDFVWKQGATCAARSPVAMPGAFSGISCENGCEFSLQPSANGESLGAPTGEVCAPPPPLTEKGNEC